MYRQPPSFHTDFAAPGMAFARARPPRSSEQTFAEDSEGVGKFNPLVASSSLGSARAAGSFDLSHRFPHARVVLAIERSGSRVLSQTWHSPSAAGPSSLRNLLVRERPVECIWTHAAARLRSGDGSAPNS